MHLPSGKGKTGTHIPFSDFQILDFLNEQDIDDPDKCVTKVWMSATGCCPFNSSCPQFVLQSAIVSGNWATACEDLTLYLFFSAGRTHNKVIQNQIEKGSKAKGKIGAA
jgi:hypothetical protein